MLATRDTMLWRQLYAVVHASRWLSRLPFLRSYIDLDFWGLRVLARCLLGVVPNNRGRGRGFSSGVGPGWFD